MKDGIFNSTNTSHLLGFFWTSNAYIIWIWLNYMSFVFIPKKMRNGQLKKSVLCLFDRFPYFEGDSLHILAIISNR